MRLIDADAVVKRLQWRSDMFRLDKRYNVVMRDAISVVLIAPSIDAVPVVRCKDCKRWGHGHPSETDKIKCCQIAGYMIGENGYCLYAEAKEDNGR